MTQIHGESAFVTGANRGIGLELARELVRRGANVYAGARDPSAIADPGLIPVRIDVTDPASVEAAAAEVGDVSILINNAGYLAPVDVLAVPFADARKHMEVNFLGTWSVARAFAPVLVKNQGAIVNMLSVSSWIVGNSRHAAYAASKSAQWSITNAFREALKPQGVQVVGVHVGYVDTDMAADVEDAKVSPARVARAAIQALVDGVDEVLVDEKSRQVKRSLSGDEPAYLS